MQVELAGDLRTNLIAALQLIADRMLSETDRMNFLTMLQRVQYDPETQRFVEMFRAQTPVHQALRQAIASGELPDSHDLSIAAAFLLGPLMQRGLMARDEIEPEFIELVVDRYLSGNGAAR